MSIQQMMFGKTTPASITYATWDPARKGTGITLSSGNAIASYSTASACVFSTNKITVKTYFEVVLTPSGAGYVVDGGLGDTTIPTSTTDLSATSAVTFWATATDIYKSNTLIASIAGSGYQYEICVDPSTREIWVTLIGSAYPFSGNPAAGTGATATIGGSSDIYAMANPFASGTSVQLISNPAGFLGSVPSGFQAGF